jgi:hypothetical protein
LAETGKELHPPSFAEVLAGLWRDKKTGMLRVKAEGVQTLLYLRRGALVFAEGGRPADMLGRMLVEAGEITDAQLAHAIQVLTDRPVEDEQVQLGTVMIELKMISMELLYESLAAQVRRKALSCFLAAHHDIELSEGEEHLEHVTPFEVPFREVLMTGVCASPPEVLESFLAGRGHLFPRLAVAIRDVERDFCLGGQDQHFLASIDGQTSVDELRRSSVGAPRAGQILVALALGDAIALDEKPTREQPAPAKPAAAARPASGGKPYGSALKEGAEPDEPAGWGQRLLDRIKRKDS